MTVFEIALAIIDPVITILAATFIAIRVNRASIRQQSRTDVTVRVIVGLDEIASDLVQATLEYLKHSSQEKRSKVMAVSKSLLVQFSFIAKRRKLFGGDTGLLNNTNDAIDRLYGFCTDDCDRGDVGSPQAFDIGDGLIQHLNDRLHLVRRELFALQLACTGE